MTTTHALVPLAATIAFANRPVPWKLVILAAVAASAPDVDSVSRHLLGVPGTSIWAHRGAAHSLFVAVAAGVVAAFFHRWLQVRPLTAGVVVAASMASHGLLDMMTDSGLPVAYLWPISSIRIFADWRPLHSVPVQSAHLLIGAMARLRVELWQLIIPMFAAALAIRGAKLLSNHR